MALGHGFVFRVDKEPGKEKSKVEKASRIGRNVRYKKEWKHFEAGMETRRNGVTYLCTNTFTF